MPVVNVFGYFGSEAFLYHNYMEMADFVRSFGNYRDWSFYEDAQANCRLSTVSVKLTCIFCDLAGSNFF